MFTLYLVFLVSIWFGFSGNDSLKSSSIIATSFKCISGWWMTMQIVRMTAWGWHTSMTTMKYNKLESSTFPSKMNKKPLNEHSNMQSICTWRCCKWTKCVNGSIFVVGVERHATRSFWGSHEFLITVFSNRFFSDKFLTHVWNHDMGTSEWVSNKFIFCQKKWSRLTFCNWS